MLLAVYHEALKVAVAAPRQFNAVGVVTLGGCKRHKVANACRHNRLGSCHCRQCAVCLGWLNGKAVTILVAHHYHIVNILAALILFLSQLNVVCSVGCNVDTCEHSFCARTPYITFSSPRNGGCLVVGVQCGMYRTTANGAVMCRRRERCRLAVHVVPCRIILGMRTLDSEFVIVNLAQRHLKLVAVCCSTSKIANVLSGSLFGAGTHFSALDGKFHLVVNVVLCRRRTKSPVHLYLTRHLIVFRGYLLNLRIGRTGIRWTFSGKGNTIVEAWCILLLYDIVQGVVKAQLACRHKEGA